MQQADVCIAGAGIIGLSLALELERRGAKVTVLERDTPLTHASQAAAGMLAAHDPENPVEMLPLSELSLRLYPAFLDRIEQLSGQHVPFQTSRTYQAVEHSLPTASLPAALNPGSHRFCILEEHSLDPRQLAPALLAAVRASNIRLLEHTTFLGASTVNLNLLRIYTDTTTLLAPRLVHTLGPWGVDPQSFLDWTFHSHRLAWAQPGFRVHEYRAPHVDPQSPGFLSPRKGQMLAVRIPSSLHLDYVVRTPDIYIVPRTQGPQAGCAVIGATVEDAGFDTRTDPASLAHLRSLATHLLPSLVDEVEAPMLDQWAALRPYTPDRLPLLGETERPNQFVATGHFRNGILLAPATAHVLAQLLASESPGLDLTPFAPERFNLPGQGILERYSRGHRDNPFPPAL